MKNQLFTAIKLSLACFILLVVIYPLAVLGIAQFTPNKGDVAFVKVRDKIVGARQIGQVFTQNKYFWGRPSAVNYDSGVSGGSNKGPSNPDYIQTVQARRDTFLVHNPSIKASEIPAELLTASGSGLDPHISLQSALVQVARIAKARNHSTEIIQKVVINSLEKSPAGTPFVNVLELNLALDRL
ncbi:K(+)-transporting ATPase subunit C [Flectobacillus longus]|uniref:K(+)-transporting ATPase subunit C n=1 Tax=Flectobacillus longus TaxID=2984207 RepID=UPI0024B87162|nr:K(+)-transporting ATPase subunit C [Flectobacillus longus]MDI9881087.1 K(+)-transporting ATPase subunit C [Flectobacillus longus]